MHMLPNPIENETMKLAPNQTPNQLILKQKHFYQKYKIFFKNEVQVGMGLKKPQKKRRDENTKRVSCCRKVMVKKDWKTTLLLLQKLSQATEQLHPNWQPRYENKSLE